MRCLLDGVAMPVRAPDALVDFHTDFDVCEPVALPRRRVDRTISLLEHPVTIVVLKEDVGFQQVLVEAIAVRPYSTETFDPLAASDVDVLAEQVLGRSSIIQRSRRARGFTCKTSITSKC